VCKWEIGKVCLTIEPSICIRLFDRSSYFIKWMHLFLILRDFFDPNNSRDAASATMG